MKESELKKLASLGFDTEKGRTSTINRLPRLIMSVRAKEKVGKTTFGLTAPKKIMYLNYDRKLEKVALDAAGVDPEDLFIKEIRVDAELTQVEHKKQMDEVADAILWALRESSGIRTIVVDTETENWELFRMAEFGKLTQVMPYQYTQLNSKYKFLLDQCDKYDKNVIFLQKLKKEYKNDAWNGRYEPSGFGKLKDIVQVNCEMYMMENDEGEEEVTLEIINNGIAASMNHMTFSGEMCTFLWVASILTGTDKEDWE